MDFSNSDHNRGAFAIVAISDYISHRVQPNSVLAVELNGPVVERGGSGLLGLLSKNQTSLNVLRNAIDQAAKDPKIVGLEIRVINPEMELAQAQEIVGLIKLVQEPRQMDDRVHRDRRRIGLGQSALPRCERRR